MRLLHVFAARRSGAGLILAGFITGVVLALSVQSLVRDVSRSSSPTVAGLRQLHDDDDDASRQLGLHHQHRHHRRRHSQQDAAAGDSEEVKVVDLTEQDRHKHKGACC